MSLYGALFSGVSGLVSQANKLGIISDNISNVNTVGYKGGNGIFETLVTNSGGAAAYSPGGVLGGNRSLVSRQGLLQATDSPTDIAVSGTGFFVVNQSPDGSGQVSYTRSGSFRADSTGNFRNSSGFYLQAWPLDREGRLPGAAGNTTNTTSSANLSSLQIVNVQNLTGSAAATSAVSIGANLNSSQTVYPGAAGTITFDALSTNNYQIAAKDIIVPGGVNSIARGDKLDITTGGGLSFTYRYGGFTFGRSIADGSDADSGLALLAGTTTLDTNPFSFTPGSNVVSITQEGHGLADGDVVTISGNTTDIGGISASEFNAKFVVTVVDDDTFTIETATSAAAAADITDNTVVTENGADADVTITLGTGHGYSVGQAITIAGSNVVNGITINGTRTITAVTTTTVTFATTTDTPPVIAAHAFSTTAGANPTVTVNVGTTNNVYAVGDEITIAGADPINGVDPNGTWTVATSSAGNITFVATGETSATQALGANPFLVSTGADPTVTVDLGGVHDYTVGDTITIAAAAATNGADVNGTFVITAIGANTIQYVATGETGGGSPAVAGGGGSATAYASLFGNASSTQFMTAGGGTSATAAISAGGGTAITSLTRPFAGNILDATNTETRFLGTTGTSGFTAAGLTFKITTAAIGTVTFSYTSSSPDVRQKQFNNLTNLAASINEVTGLSARVVDGQLYVGATDANAAVMFENGSAVGVEGPPVQAGIDWVRELGLKNIEVGANRFSSLEGLFNLATTDAGISASLSNPLGAAQLSINVDDPLDSIHFADSPTASALTAFTSTTPFTTTSGSETVKVTHPAAHGFSTGDFVTLDASDLADTTTLGSAPFTTTSGADPTVTVDITGLGLTYVAGDLITIAGATAVNGVDVNGTWTIVSASTTAVTFVATDETSTGTAAGGGTAATSSYGSFNGIPIGDFSGRFEITVTSPTEYTIQTDTAATASGATGQDNLLVTPHNNLGSLVAEFGLVDSLNGDAYTPQETDDFGPSYSPTDTTLNMASGNVPPQFSRPIRIFDAQGGGHDLNVAFLKTSVNTWAIEVFAVPADDVSSSLPDGLVAFGNVTFNGDGTLRSIDNTLNSEVDITWTNGASSSAVTFSLGTAGQPFGTVGATTIGQADGLSQFNAAFGVSFVNQNGAPVGELTGVAITELGVVVASYSNGETQDLYKIPLASFANPDQLTSSSGNVFTQSANSGEFNLREAGTSGVGVIAASSLEASNVELSAQLTDMIIAQRSYQANTKVISTADSLLEELNRIIQ
ncbi:MAG: flagellar hook-basal body complex protein [Alphaproteobacteria bacterium]|nr:flagellar hook-basal body complex protein [Alphaproteobacteria bacterium]